MRRKVEILAPAGSWESLEAGICAGADAVYAGGSRFGARAYADNFNEEQLLRAVDYVHLHGRRLYLAVNTLLKDGELRELYAYLLPYYEQGLDAVIVQDIGVMQYIRKHFPELPIHVSTQVSVSHALGAALFGRLGAGRIVPARELSLAEVRGMKEKTGLEIECFVHGAMCYCYSGQCLFSSLIGGRSGNRGQCAQPCRLPYRVKGKKPLSLLSLKDMCTIDLLPELVEAGIDSFKIEGRMKSPDYVYEVAGMYRKYVDLYLEKGREEYRVSETDRKRLEGAYERRGYCDGYYKRQNGRDMISIQRPENGAGAGGGSKDEKKDYKIKEKIRGKLSISKGKRAKLCLEYHGNGKAAYVEALGDTAGAACKAPLEREHVERQMRKTGNTEFAFTELDVELEEGVFLPVQSLNTLRREAVRTLQGQILSRCRRQAAEEKKPQPGGAGQAERTFQPASAGQAAEERKPQPGGAGQEDKGKSGMSFQVSVSDACQLDAALGADGIDVIYVDGNVAFDRDVLRAVSDSRKGNAAAGRKIYAAMPYIFRQRGISCYEPVYEKLVREFDGVLIRNWESLEWLREKGYPKEIVSDYNLYVFNRESEAFIKGTGISDYTLPVELNLRELGLRKPGQSGGGILAAYGRQPVMVTANCIRKTALSCRKEEGILWLTDRRKKKFAVKNYCKYCYNVIYNSAPLMTADMAEEIRGLKPSGIRLDFSTEDGKTAAEVIRLYQRAFLHGEKVRLPEVEYTRGHLKRGVRQVEVW